MKPVKSYLDFFGFNKEPLTILIEPAVYFLSVSPVSKKVKW